MLVTMTGTCRRTCKKGNLCTFQPLISTSRQQKIKMADFDNGADFISLRGNGGFSKKGGGKKAKRGNKKKQAKAKALDKAPKRKGKKALNKPIDRGKLLHMRE